MTRTITRGLIGLGLALISTAGLASQPENGQMLPVPSDESPTLVRNDSATALDELQPGDRLDQALYERGQVSRFGIRREIVRIGNHEFIIDDQDRQIIHISVY